MKTTVGDGLLTATFGQTFGAGLQVVRAREKPHNVSIIFHITKFSDSSVLDMNKVALAYILVTFVLIRYFYVGC